MIFKKSTSPVVPFLSGIHIRLELLRLDVIAMYESPVAPPKTYTNCHVIDE